MWLNVLRPHLREASRERGYRISNWPCGSLPFGCLGTWVHGKEAGRQDGRTLTHNVSATSQLPSTVFSVCVAKDCCLISLSIQDTGGAAMGRDKRQHPLGSTHRFELAFSISVVPLPYDTPAIDICAHDRNNRNTGTIAQARESTGRAQTAGCPERERERERD